MADKDGETLRLVPRDPRPRVRTFWEFVDDDGNHYGEVTDRAPAVPVIHMTILGAWKWDRETQRISSLMGVRRMKYKWQHIIVDFIDSDEQAYFLSICD